MPTYSTHCTACQQISQTKLTFSEYDLVTKEGLTLTCSCGKGNLEIQFRPGDVGFVMKEGPSGGWVSKSMRENKYRAKRSEVMAQKQRDHAYKPKLVPNYKGETGSSWKEVRDHVRSEKGVDSASTYDNLVKKETSK